MTKTSSKPAESRLESDRRPDGKFAPGNCANPKGRIPGSRNKATLAAQALLDGEVENLTRKAVELALGGDTTALRLCLERILPARKEAALIPINLPQVEGAADLPQLTAAILDSVAAGRITPGEGQALAALANAHAKTLEIAELEQRITALEKR
ncbi:DUF5681 domain-containing protein [Desulfovibrio fairfieldensis]|uniref:DUF5681 domain-containing protein n=1 Tax=Desulfovibrio fairfieldensis TaxID=44742 RepID=A0A0X8JHD7_9BACT|nr:DUF5681 domain-containing protein [Desulfovibrio fairfieldensis]AMD88845.1 hypothetical protein AXF13_01210 [Desulfovibrio fairfieldensis]